MNNNQDTGQQVITADNNTQIVSSSTQGEPNLVNNIDEQKISEQQNRPEKSKKKSCFSKMSLDTKEKLVLTITLANSMMGTSYLALPYNFKRTGWALGIISLLFCACWTTVGYIQTVKAAEAVQIGSLRQILQTIFGKVIAYIFDGAVCLEYTGYLICYVTVVADYFRLAIINFANLEDDQININYVKLGFGAILLLLSLIKTLTCFSRIASFAMLFICVTVVSVAVYCIIAHVNGSFEMNIYDPATATSRTEVEEAYNWGSLAGPEATNGFYAFLEFFMRLPIYQTLFGVYATITAVYHDMQTPVEKKAGILHKSSIFATIVATVIYAASALFGNALFGRKVASNILLSFLPSNIWMTVCRLLSCFSVSVSYVLITYPVRTIVLSWLPFKEGSKGNKVSFYIIGFVIVVITVALSIAIPDIETVLNFISAIFGCVWYSELVAMMVFADPLIKAAKIDREIVELRKSTVQQDTEQRNPLEIIARRSSFVYEIGTEKEARLSLEIQNQQRKSINLTQLNDKIPQNSDQQQEQKQQTEQKQEDNNNDQQQEQQEQPEQQQETVQNTNENQMPVIAVEQAPEQISAPQSPEQNRMTSEDEVEQQLLEQRKEVMKKMNKCRKAVFGIVTIIIIIINLEAFILSTFFDMTQEHPFS